MFSPALVLSVFQNILFLHEKQRDDWECFLDMELIFPLSAFYAYFLLSSTTSFHAAKCHLRKTCD